MPSEDDLDRDGILLEFARMSGLLYPLNPRNFEDRWYALWLLKLDRLCHRLTCYALATAQDSLWPGNTQAGVTKRADANPPHPPEPEETDPEDSEAHVGDRGQDHDSPDSDDDPPDEVDEDLEILDVVRQDGQTAFALVNGGSSASDHRLGASASQEEVTDGHHPPQPAFPRPVPPFPPSGSTRTDRGGSKDHRVPDSAINGYYSLDFTPAAMKEAIRKRQQWTTDGIEPDGVLPSVSSATEAPNNRTQSASGATSSQVQSDHVRQGATAKNSTKDASRSKTTTKKSLRKPDVDKMLEELRKRPPSDPEDFDVLRNPIKLYHGYNVVEFKLVNAESKRLPSRQESEEQNLTWDEACNKYMTEAQLGNMKQISVFFSSSHWNHQDSVLLLGTTGDFYTHTIASRNPEKEGPTFTVLPWSRPVWVGSEASKRREKKIVDWLNATFNPDAMKAIALKMRDDFIARLQQQAAAQDNAHDDSAAQSGPSEPRVPVLPPSPPKTRAMTRKFGGSGPEDLRGKDAKEGKGKGKARADPPPPAAAAPAADNEQDFDGAASALSPVLEADEGPGVSESSDSDEDAPPRKKARTELPPEGSPSITRSCSPSSAGGDTQPVASASARPVPTRRGAASSTQPDPSTSTQPAASTSKRRRSARAPHPVKFFDAPGKKDAQKNKLKRARSTMN